MSDTIPAPGPGGRFLGGPAGAVSPRTGAVPDAIRHASPAAEMRPGRRQAGADPGQRPGVPGTAAREWLKMLAGRGPVTVSPQRGAAARLTGPATAAALDGPRLLRETA